MIKSPKRKGTRGEHGVVKLLESYGFPSLRHAGSGAFAGLEHDASTRLPGLGRRTIEVKVRANGEGFATLERWKGGADWLILKRDRGPFLLLCELDEMAQAVALIAQLEAALETARTGLEARQEGARRIA